MKRLLGSLQPVWRLCCRYYRRCCLYYFEAALRQIDPLHDDVPLLVLRVNELKAQGAVV